MSRLENWYSLVSGYGCIVCRNQGAHVQPELHHLWGRKKKKGVDYEPFVIPLCVMHHRGGQGVHNGKRSFTEAYGHPYVLFAQMRREIGLPEWVELNLATILSQNTEFILAQSMKDVDGD